MSLNMLKQGIMYEYTGTITQLGATSEVVIVGFRFTVPDGERILITNLRIVVDNLGGNKNLDTVFLNNSLDVIAIITAIGADNQSFYPIIIKTQAGTTDLPDAHGYSVLPILGGGQALQARITDTLDASKTLKIIMSYISTTLPFTAASIGSGISISAETHVSV